MLELYQFSHQAPTTTPSVKADPNTVMKEDTLKKEKVIYYTTYYITHTKPCPNEDTQTSFLLVLTYEQKLTDVKTIDSTLRVSTKLCFCPGHS